MSKARPHMFSSKVTSLHRTDSRTLTCRLYSSLLNSWRIIPLNILHNHINTIARLKSTHTAFLMSTLCAVKAFVPSFTADRGESMTHFSIFNQFGGIHWVMLCNCRYESMCVSVVLRCNVWVMNVKWGRVKEKPGAGISLLLSKSNKWRVSYSHVFRFLQI